MNRIKSIFIGVYPMLVMGIAGYAGYQLYLTRAVLVWLPPLLTTLPFMLFLSRVMMFQNVARTSAKFPLLNLLAWCGVGLSAYATFAAAGPLLALWLTLAGALGFAVYSLWYSRLGRTPSNTVRVGQPFPALTFQDVKGAPYRTNQLKGSPAILFFYRGNWCPLCMAQIKEVAARYRELAKLGARVLLISPQPHDNSVALAKRFEVDFEFLTDTGGKAANQLGIEMKNGLPLGMGLLGYHTDTVFPTVIVLDQHGVVQWLDQTDNYRVRPEPDTFLPILRSLATES